MILRLSYIATQSHTPPPNIIKFNYDNSMYLLGLKYYSLFTIKMCISSEIAPEFKILYNISVIISHPIHNPTPLKYTTFVIPPFLLLNTFFSFSLIFYIFFSFLCI
jgi:hypothetical protein